MRDAAVLALQYMGPAPRPRPLSRAVPAKLFLRRWDPAETGRDWALSVMPWPCRPAMLQESTGWARKGKGEPKAAVAAARRPSRPGLVARLRGAQALSPPLSCTARQDLGWLDLARSRHASGM